MDELRQLIEQLLDILRKYGKPYMNPERRQLICTLSIIDSNLDEAEKMKRIKRIYKELFPPKSNLSEFYIWDDNFEKRKELNTALENIKKRLWKIMG